MSGTSAETGIASDVVLAAPDGLWIALYPKVCTVAPRKASAKLARPGGLESARIRRVIPIAVVISAAAIPACGICRRKRSATGITALRHRRIRGPDSVLIPGSVTGSSLLSTDCNGLLLSCSIGAGGLRHVERHG